MHLYHGTKKSDAALIVDGSIDITKGGGELGMGFYTGEYLWVAKSWARNVHKADAAVVELSVPDDDYFKLEPLLLSRTDALAERNKIKAASATRTYTFGSNVVWSPIVGTTRVDADQHKFESKASEALLNDSKTPRKPV